MTYGAGPRRAKVEPIKQKEPPSDGGSFVRQSLAMSVSRTRRRMMRAMRGRTMLPSCGLCARNAHEKDCGNSDEDCFIHWLSIGCICSFLFVHC
jgi:hypothetical protein